ncbi:MAG: hypothetical protein SVY53_13065 [Chloroflexota bacterium]|nr:hypothetical protein [Chloroflexota bacterium]
MHELSKVVYDVWTNLGWTSLDFAVDVGTWYNLKAVILDDGPTNRLQVHINDVMYIDDTDKDLDFAGLAFLSYDWNDDFHIAYDNFRVRQYVSQEPTVLLGPESHFNS